MRLLLASIKPTRLLQQSILSRNFYKTIHLAAMEKTIPEGFVEIVEGTAKMLYNQNEAVFYNKVQVLNRDLSIQVIKLYSEIVQKERTEKYERKLAKYNSSEKTAAEMGRAPFPPEQGITILDALAASGLRSIRYLNEIPLARQVTINDLLPAATQLAQENCVHNSVDMEKVAINNGDAIMVMYSHRDPKDQYDVIDLDPYGTASPFLDSAVQAVKDGGLLCVTCTDMTVLGGTFPEVCFAKYQSMPLKATYLHEMSLRILLHAIDTAANKYKKHIVPWISLSIDFYVRVFVRVYEAPNEVKNSCLKRAMVYQSTQCPSFYVHRLGYQKSENRKALRNLKKGKGNQSPGADIEEEREFLGRSTGNKGAYGANAVEAPSVCEETGGRLKLGGPFWSDPIHNQEIVDELLKRTLSVVNGEAVDEKHPIPTAKRLSGVLASISEELKDVPLYYSLPGLSSAVECSTPTYQEVYSALSSLGYRYSQFHHDCTALKTDAPPQVIWDIMRAYRARHPTAENKKKAPSKTCQAILSKEIKTQNIDFSRKVKRHHVEAGVARFPPNPESNWGPKRRAGRKLAQEGKEQQDNDEEVVELVEEDKDASSPDHKRMKK